jgi:sec-independent protein translocase protein TatB
MFDIGFSELLLIAVLALLVLGPKRLPEAARLAGRALGKLRAFLTEARRDFDRELNTAEMDELRVLNNELSETKRMLSESANRVYDDVVQHKSDVESALAAASPAATTDRSPSVPRARKRKPATSAKKTTSNGRKPKR